VSARRVGLAFVSFLAAALPLAAEPIFLSRQYAHCTNCHYSPTGGGLLTPYGRSLSREELSTFGKSPGGTPKNREHEFLFGLLGKTLGPVSLGIDLRPSYLHFDLPGGVSEGRDLLMNADITAAYRYKTWTFYAELGRQPRGDDPRVASFEHWVGYQSERFGARAGRFLPAYGVKFADHTTFNRAPLGFDNDDQVYALELSYRGERHLAQVSFGPGKADDVDDSTLQAFTASGRFQFDLTPRTVLVASGLYRDGSDVVAKNGSTGLAFGVAPLSRLTVWTQGDIRFQEGDFGGHAYTVLAQAAFEVVRGLWLTFTPQLETAYEGQGEGTRRLAAGINWLPRTHWNVVVNYYDDKDRASGLKAKTILLQLHLYL
jgi:hypothetical protein